MVCVVYNEECLDVEGLSLLLIQVVKYIEFQYACREAPSVRVLAVAQSDSNKLCLSGSLSSYLLCCFRMEVASVRK